MIVKCEQCQTRFKIPDDKVTDKGVKVRCTKCSHTFRVTRDMAQPATATMPALGAAPPAGDPFARFGAPAADPPNAEVTRPGVFAMGIEASRKPAPPYPAAPPRPQQAAPFDFGSLTPPGVATAPTIPSVPAYIPPAAAASPFDFAAIARPAGAPAAPPPAAFDFSNFAAPSAPPPAAQAPPYPPPPPPPPQAAAPPAFDFSQAAEPEPAPAAFDFAQASPPAPAPAAFDMGGFQNQSSAPMDAFPAGGSADGFFAGADDAGPSSSLPVDGAAARAMFDMPTAAPAALLDLPPPEAEAPSSSSRNIERVPLGRAQSVPAPVVQRPAPEAPPRRRSVVGLFVNVVIAAVLVLGLVVVGSAYVNEGKFTTEALSLEGLKNTFAPSVDFVANDVSNGLYETRAGRSVFFVRGEVMNRSEAAVKVVVKAELMEGEKVVRFGESWAGEPASPEEIFLIENTESLEALNAKVEKRSLVVPAGGAAPFVVPFTEFPPDLKDFRVRVSARAVPVSPTASKQ